MAAKRKGYMTLAERDAQLKAEGKWDAYVAGTKERDEAIRRKTEEYARAEAPLVQELRAAGAPVSSVWDLVNTKARYPKLVPILFAHLDRPYPERLRGRTGRPSTRPTRCAGCTDLSRLGGYRR